MINQTKTPIRTRRRKDAVRVFVMGVKGYFKGFVIWSFIKYCFDHRIWSSNLAHVECNVSISNTAYSNVRMSAVKIF